MRPVISIVVLSCFALSEAQPLGAQTSPGTLRLSWAGCDQIRTHTDLSAGPVAQLVISQIGTDIPNVGHDMMLELGPDLPDAWRFDDNGCQGYSQRAVRSSGFSKTCPSMRIGENFEITYYSAQQSGRTATFRLLNTFAHFLPDPLARYTWWIIEFDHSYSVMGSDEDPATCDGGDVPICISNASIQGRPGPEILGNDGIKYYPAFENTFVTWGREALACESVVPTHRATWGRVKAQYR